MSSSPTETRTLPDPCRAGFTLIELVLAVGLLGGSFLGLLLLRTSAIDRATQFNLDRIVQRVAQEKLDEVVFGIEETKSGSIDDRPGWSWEVDVYPTEDTADRLAPLLEAMLTLRYPGSRENEEEEYQLTTRFFAHEQHPLREFAETGDTDATGTGF